jgi:ABC-type multidrug transport system fused ATPase/permease subunit
LIYILNILGKSTILSLIERLYDPISGEILFDNYNIKTLDLNYLRSLIGYVPQQPVLLNTSIKENIIFGREGILDEDINIAVKNSKSDDFVTMKGIDFNVGAGGKMLSGGQKQRIAIARAIVNKPKILIFDEATSALDNICEQDVQKALDSVCKGLSSITVAHRITTIKNADKIVCLNNGSVEDEGTHHELKKNSLFYLRLINEEEEENDEEFNEEAEEYYEKENKFDDNEINEKDRADNMIINMDEEKLENDSNQRKSAYQEEGKFNLS